MLQITPFQAKRIALKHQGLLRHKSFAKRESGILQVFDQLGYIQIDTISVINRAHHHTLWARLSDYVPEKLYDLQRSRDVFEYWSHAAAYLPIQHYRYTLPRKIALASGEKKHWYEREPKVMQYVLDQIRAEGPMQSKDFQHAKNPDAGPWYQWKPSKRALEQLFMEGQLMITERRNFQKVFDLTERVVPSHVDTSIPSDSDMARYLILSFLQAHGLALESEMTYLRKQYKQIVGSEIPRLLEEKKIIEVQIAGDEQTYLALWQVQEELGTRLGKKQIHLLSPFDNLVIQRKRLENLFGFEYQIECYVPQAKRKFGYFCLPILWGDTFIGRVDCKIDRKQKHFMIQSLWIESNLASQDIWLPSLAKTIRAFASFHNSEEIHIRHCSDNKVKTSLQQFLNNQAVE
ncbi:MAG: crosslink repair DNA glycosylase YcaQ family protein [Bacteroidota bacterium]